LAGTEAQQNNKAVAFKGRMEREMPSSSQAQNHLMHAAAEGKVEGVPKSVGKDFVKADAGRKIGKLPKHVRHKAKRLAKSGMISDRQMKKLEG
jgi:hypothetical protein